jgi:dethiobiotin synthetase
MSFKGFFITGTDTEVGKTLVAGAIILKLQSMGIKALGFKPVVAGMQQMNGNLVNEDIETLLMVSREICPSLIASDICPYFLKDPAAPHLVAFQYRIELTLQKMMAHYGQLANKADVIVVEGAGGFLVPLNEEITLGDFAQQLDLPVILVIDIKLGCINHALLTAEAITRRGLVLHGWVANSTQLDPTYTSENLNTLRNILKKRFNAQFLGHIPHLSEPSNKGIYTIEILTIATNYFQLYV